MTQSGWDSTAFAETWTSGSGVRNRVLGPATERMLVEARLGPGARVLDVGTGTGDTALLAAERVGASGVVVATDASPAMLAAAAAAVRASRLDQVRVQSLDLSDLALPVPPTTLAEERPFDAIIARNVLMFVPIARALIGLIAFLRPAGRFSAVVWSALANNPYHRVVLDAARARGAPGEPTPEVVRAFELGDPTFYARQLAFAGYRDVAVHPVPSIRRFASAREAVEAIRASPIHSEPITRLPIPKQADAWKEVEDALRAFELDDVCEIPLESLVVVGER